MNYEQMMSRLLAGLNLINTRKPGKQPGAHAMMICVPDVLAEDFTAAQAQSLKDNGWLFHNQFGAVFPTIG